VKNEVDLKEKRENKTPSKDGYFSNCQLHIG
jgi:hypothetical protein